MIISSYRKDLKDYNEINFHPEKGDLRKNGIFQKTFAKFPQTRINLYEVIKTSGKNNPHRWEVIRDNCADFDIFIDDNYDIVSSTSKKFPSDKIYVLADYKFSRHLQGSNIFHVKISVSDLKDEDFAVAALEYRIKQLEKELKTTKQERVFESNRLFI